MKRFLSLLIICFFNLMPAFSFVNPMVDSENPMFEEALSERIVGYEVSANIDVTNHIISGNEKIFWFNNTKKSVNIIKFHLYMNAFSSLDTKLMKSAKKNGIFKNYQFNEKTAGYTIINSISVNFSNLTDDLKVDGTVATLELPYNINPGESIVLNIGFITKLPRIIIRSGYAGSYHFAGQWFPKIGVLNELGDWECNRYLLNGEFFSDFGVYKCSLTYPKSYTVVATGEKREESINKELKTSIYYAEDVHDFAFSLWDKFQSINKEVLGKKLYVYYPKGHEKLAVRIMDALVKSFNWYSKNMKEYPYPDYKVIDVPFNGLYSGGMEYETMCTTVAFTTLPEFVRLPEKVTIHEFGHSYFQGMVANNESDEGWLDEGLNTYMTAMLMDEFYGECSFINNKWFCRTDFENLLNGDLEDLKFQFPSMKIEAFVSNKGYRQAIYKKTALLLKTVENYLGREVVMNVLNRYVNEFAFKHPKGEDFIKILNEETENSFNGLVDSVINSEIFPDASVISVKTYKNDNFKGFVNKDNKMMYLQENKVEKGMEYEVVFGKRELPISMNYKITLSDGNEITGVMMGDETIKKVIVNTKKGIKVTEAWIDYDKKAFIDLNRDNNKYNESQNKIIKPVSLTMFFILLEWISYVF